MRRSLRRYLTDILDALTRIEQYLEGVSFEQYRQTSLISRATEREFIIIGEAIRQLEQHFPETRDRVQQISKIISFRNFIIHEYSHVDDASVWDVAAHDAPVLYAQVQRWKDELD